MSARKKIEDALKATPTISLDELKNLLPDINAVTLKSDFYKLKRKLFGPVQSKKPKAQQKIKKISRRQQVLEYLSKNAEATFDSLQSTFSDVGQTTLRNYLSVWKKDQKNDSKKKEQPETLAKKTQKVPKKKQTEKPARKTQTDNTELIESLKKTIAAQEKTIETMKKTFDLLSPDSHEEELKGMTLSEIKKIATTYLKSIRELPAKIRR
jgi:hypothetical protein